MTKTQKAANYLKRVVAQQSAPQKALDLAASTLLEPKTLLTKGAGAAIDKVRNRRLTGRPSDVIGETLTATALYGGAIMAAANPVGAFGVAKSAAKFVAPKSVRGALGYATGLGILSTSKTARDYVMGHLSDPTKTGRQLGRFLDTAVDKSKEKAKDTNNKWRDFLIPAGVGAGALGTSILAGKALKNKLSTYFVQDNLPSVGMGTNPNSGYIPSSNEPVIKTAEALQESKLTPAPVVNVKINNKPQINVAVAQSI